MLEFYYSCAGALLIGLLIGAGSRLWNMPTPRPQLKIGTFVRIQGEGLGVYRITGECGCDIHAGPRALFVALVTPSAWMRPPGSVAVLHGWYREQDLTPAIVGEFKPPNELEARELNERFGITCDSHPLEDCTHKGRQRADLGLPGHQR